MPVGAQRHFLAEREAGGAIDDHFIVAAQNFAPGRKLPGAARPARLEADEKQAERLAVQFGLHRLVGDRARALHAIDSADQFARVAWDARGFGERPIGAGLDHPEIGVSGAGLPQRVVDQAAIDTGDHDHDAEQQAQSEIGQNEAQQIVLDIPVGQIHWRRPLRDLGRAAGAQPAAQLRDHHGLVRHAAGDFIAPVEQPVSERHRALLQAPILDRPHRPAVFAKPDDRRFRHQQRLREPHRGDVDLGLLAKMEVSRQLIERDLDPALFVDAIAFGLDAGNLPAIPLARLRSQHDFGRLADFDLAGFALVDKGKHPD